MDETIELRWMKEKDSSPVLQFREKWDGNWDIEYGEWEDVPVVDERGLSIK